jgi:hypothetical protein
MSVRSEQKPPIEMAAERYPAGTLVKMNRGGQETVHKVRSRPFFDSTGKIVVHLEGWKMPVLVGDLQRF